MDAKYAPFFFYGRQQSGTTPRHTQAPGCNKKSKNEPPKQNLRPFYAFLLPPPARNTVYNHELTLGNTNTTKLGESRGVAG